MNPSLIKLCSFLLSLTLVSAFTSHSAQYARLPTFRPMFSGDEPGIESEVSSLAEVAEGEDSTAEARSLGIESEVSSLAEVAEGEDSTAETRSLEPSTLDDNIAVQNFGRAGEVKEVKWVDPAMSANTNPFNMSVWAYALFGFPMVLLANDFLHFIPESAKDGPLGFLL